METENKPNEVRTIEEIVKQVCPYNELTPSSQYASFTLVEICKAYAEQAVTLALKEASNELNNVNKYRIGIIGIKTRILSLKQQILDKLK